MYFIYTYIRIYFHIYIYIYIYKHVSSSMQITPNKSYKEKHTVSQGMAYWLHASSICEQRPF